MRFGDISILNSFVALVLLTAMWPSGWHFSALNELVAQDVATPKVKAEPAKAAPLAPFSPGTERTIKAEQALKKIVSLQFEKTPFSEVEQKLEALSGLNFFLHHSASDDSLAADEEFSIDLVDLPLNQGLSLLLGTKNATYVIDDGVVILISLDEADDDRWLRLKMYDCRELVKALLADNRPGANGEQTLLDMVQAMVRSESWGESGFGGTAVLANGTLIVNQTEEVHLKIEKFLLDLEVSLLRRMRPRVIESKENREIKPVERPAKNRSRVRILNLPPVSAARTADQFLYQLEVDQYVNPTLRLPKHEFEKVVQKLRNRFPLRSIRNRLHFQEGEPAAIDYRRGYSDRRGEALQALHSKNVDSFISRSGQGVGRGVSPPPVLRDLFSRDRRFAEKEETAVVDSALLSEEQIEIDQTVKMKDSGYRALMGKLVPDHDFINSLSPDGLPKQQALSVFNTLAADSFAKQDTGFVKSIDEVAEFRSHRIRFEDHWLGDLRRSEQDLSAMGIGAAGPKIVWKVNRFQLVSLLMHDQPCVYDVDELPNMENLSSETANTRPLNDFETNGLNALKSGEELFVRATKNRILMTGAIRASKSCLACHTVKQNDLLGAFSYEFLRFPRAQLEPVRKFD